MCNAFSWAEASKKIFFLSDRDWKKYFRRFPDDSKYDFPGHSAIEHYYDVFGKDHESTTEIPTAIYKMYRAGLMTKALEYSDPRVTFENDKWRKVPSREMYRLTGGVFFWRVNGDKIHKKENYKNGKPHGKLTWWHPNGNKAWERNYCNGKLHGKGIRWYRSGKKAWEVNYRNEKLHGKCIDWDENGNKRWEKNYQNGERI